MNKFPKARTAEIVVQNLNDEVLIYDLKTDQAFCLNETLAKVFNHCDGQTTFATLKENQRLTDEIIYLALDELKKNDLLADNYTSPFAGMSRRQVIRKVGLASMIALPVISGIVAPGAATAASGGFPPNSRSLDETCSSSTECMTTAPKCTLTGDGSGATYGTRCCVATSMSRARRADTVYSTGDVTQENCDIIAPSYCCSGRGTVSGNTCVCQ